jgi:uncharacterized protein (DUF885 family)
MWYRQWLGVVVLTLGIAGTGPEARANAAATPAAGEELRTLVERYFDDYLALNPLIGTLSGEAQYNDQFVDTASAAWRTATHDLEQRALTELQRIDVRQLSEQDRLTWEIFARDRRSALEAERFPRHYLPLDQMDSLPLLFGILGGGLGPQPFVTVADYDHWFLRARGFPAWVDSAIANMREGARNGVTQPRVVMQKVLPQLDALIAEDPTESPFYGPVRRMPAAFPDNERARLTLNYTGLIQNRLTPALKRLRAFVADEYLPQCRETVAWSSLPDGEAWYRYRVADATTTTLSPDEIHAIGLREVARIRGEMEGVRRKVGFDGDLHAFFIELQTDPQFYFDTPEALLAAYGGVKKRIDALLPKLFSDLPTIDYEIRPVESFREKAAAGAYYQSAPPDGSRPAVFYVNTWNLMAQPKFGLETLSLHEASPGHHLQQSVQRALTDLPRFRRFGGYVAYSEGWALYAESLGRELGLYTDPYQYYGHLSDEMLRAMRLVVDTGLHAKGWTRTQAMAYMRENSSMAPSDIEAEVDRYIVWPGQALGYKVGELRIEALRRRAERALGRRFDVKRFHHEILRDGAVPLDLLDAKIDRWIAIERRRG